MTSPRDPTLTLILNAALPLLHLAYEQVLRTIEAAVHAYGANAPAELPALMDTLHGLGKGSGGRAELKRVLAEAMARAPDAGDPTSQVIGAILTVLDREVEPETKAADSAPPPPPEEAPPAPHAADTGGAPARLDPFALTRQQLLHEILRVLGSGLITSS